jgi:carboxyl-terminal processing protease
MTRRFVLLVSIFTLISICTIALAETAPTETAPAETQDTGKQPYTRDDVYQELELFSTALSYVLSNYNNSNKDITKEQLDQITSEAIQGMLQGLGDRYSYYQAETKRKREQENLFFAKFGGIGIRILPSPDGFVNIVQPIDGTPAMKAGLHAGDKIVMVDGKSIENQSMDDVVDMIRGEVGTKITLTILRQGVDSTFDAEVTRAIINYPSIKSTMIDDQIGYIIISDFTAETGAELKQSIQELKGMKGLILDLRNNPGGMLTAAVDVSNAFIPEGVIVSTDGRMDRFDSVYKANKDNMFFPANMPMVLLVNGSSASGSEIVAGAIKDYKRGLIIGEKTFGKGVVQQRFPLNETGSKAVSITVSIYKTPNGDWINEQLLFIINNEFQKDIDEEKISEKLIQEFTNNKIQLSQNATIKIKDRIRDKGVSWQINDGQQIYTIKKEEGKLKVYKGGVPPDIEVEQPNLLENDKDGEQLKMLTKFYEGEYANKFVYDYMDKNKAQSPEEQLNSLLSNVPELMKTLESNGIKLNERLLRMYVRRTFVSTQNGPNIDLENDLQLARAVEEIKKQI